MWSKMEHLQGNICVLKTILETCDDKMTEETKKKVQNFIDELTKKLEEQKKNEMEVEYYYSVSEESDSEEEVDEELKKQLEKDWEEECRKQEEESDVERSEYDDDDEV